MFPIRKYTTKEQFSSSSRYNSCYQINRNSCTLCKIIYILLTFKEVLATDLRVVVGFSTFVRK